MSASLDNAYEKLWNSSREAISIGNFTVEEGPREGGRWPLSVALRLDANTMETLRVLALELEPLIGEIYHFDHHITVRGLQPHFGGVTADSPAVRGYVEALAEAVKNLERPIEVHFRGVALTPSGVMVCGYPVNDAADEFRSLLAESLALRNLDSYERHMARDIWHATLAGFAGKLCDPNALIDWVAARRTMDLGITTCVRAEVTRWTARDHRQIGIPLSSTGIPN